MKNNDDDNNDNNDNNDDNDNEEKTKRSIAIAYSRLLFMNEMSCINFNKNSVLHIIMMSVIVTYLIFVRG